MWVTKLLISPVEIRIFCPKTSKFGLKFAFLAGLAGSFGALLVGWLVIEARRLYLARHLFTLLYVLVNQECCFVCLFILKGVKHRLNVYDTARCCLIIEILKNLFSHQYKGVKTGSNSLELSLSPVCWRILLSWTKNT